MKKVVLLCTMGCMLVGCQKRSEAPSQGQASAGLSDTLTTALEAVQDSSDMPGFAVALVQNDEVRYLKGFGFSDLANKKPYTENTVQPIASVSKTFIGLSVMMLVEDGQLSLDQGINSILPYTIVNPYFPEAEITVRHLVTHTSTITDDFDDLDESIYWLLEESPYTEEDISEEIYDRISYFKRGKPIELDEYITNICLPGGKWYVDENFLNTTPGSTFEYSNLGASIAARIVELKSGMSFSDFTHERIFEPLGMENTGYFYSDMDAELIANLYAKSGNDIAPVRFPRYHDAGYPEGQLKTSVADMSKYVLEMIRGLKGEGQLLGPSAYDTLFLPQLEDRHFEERSEYPFNDEYNMGVFWGESYPGYILHNGLMDGVLAFVVLNPETNTGIFALTNMHDNYIGDVRAILHRYLDPAAFSG